MSSFINLRSGAALFSLALLTSLSPQTHRIMAQEKADASASPLGYFLGLDVGTSMARQGFKADDFDASVFALGMADALAGRDSRLSDEQLREVQGKLQAMMQKRSEEQQAAMKEAAAMNKEKGAMWLEKNAKAEGVRTLEGGVQIKTVKPGSGASPSVSDQVTVHYTGKLTDGTVFDSSVARGEPATFMLGQVIKGWQIALQEMKVGEKAIVYIPSDLAYGSAGSPPAIGPNEVLVFEVELLDIP